MAGLPKHLRLPGRAHRWALLFINSLNFYRVHLLAFTIIPLVLSAIMYGVNTEYKIEYIDCLFNCFSAMTVTGLATVNLSTLSPVQQVIIFIQMLIGSPTMVSLMMIIVRRHFFRTEFKHVIQERQKKRPGFNLAKTFSRATTFAPTALRNRFGKSTTAEHVGEKEDDSSGSTLAGKAGHQGHPTDEPVHTLKVPTTKQKPKKKKHIDTSMIKRIDGGGVGLMNPMGWYDAERAENTVRPPTSPPSTPILDSAAVPDSESSAAPSVAAMRPPSPLRLSGVGPESRAESRAETADSTDESRTVSRSESRTESRDRSESRDREERRDTFPNIIRTESPTHMDSLDQRLDEMEGRPARAPYAGRPLTDEAFPRSKTIAFDDDDEPPSRRLGSGFTTARESAFPRTATMRSTGGGAGFPRTATNSSFPRTYTLRPTVSRKPDTRLSGFGGFPTPFELLSRAAQKFAPEASRTFTKSLSVSRTNTLGRQQTLGTATTDTVQKPYISFEATVGRNSRFTGLTEEQMDELGGVEYRALRVLFYIVICYISFLLVASFIIVTPYIQAKGRYDEVFEDQPRLVRIPWFSLFQVVSAFSNTGMSLVDKSMLPFQTAYVMIVVMMFLVFAGNTAFPILLRLTVYVIYRLSPATSRLKETLKFLLDHPRRCFIYLFPSTQTWVLALVMLSLTLTDWVCFLVLDIGTEAIQALPIGTRIAAGFLQSAAVRAAGFAIVPIAELAPAVKVLYTIMMYISVYPVALSVRATNVYEERSLGLFNDEEEEMEAGENEEGAQAVAKYLGWHARRQLAFDIWWLGFALWLICIIERGELEKDESASWFNIFAIIFELVSGYGTVGLSLGLPYDNYSLSGGFRKLSKLVLCAVMLRGRHRGLPVAIDRAVMLPKDFTAAEEEALEETRSRRMSRLGSVGLPDDFLGHPYNARRSSMMESTAQTPNFGPRRGSTSSSREAGREAEYPASPGRERGRRRSISPTAFPRDHRGPSPQVHAVDHHAPGNTTKSATSPTTLQFALPRVASLDYGTGGGGGYRGGSGGGSLTPVQEGLSRANTRA